VADYNPQEIEAKMAKALGRSARLRYGSRSPKPKYYTLEMLPYPSGTLHMGHMRQLHDWRRRRARKRMRASTCFIPWVGRVRLPAENAAIANKRIRAPGPITTSPNSSASCAASVQLRLAPRNFHLRTGILSLEPVVFPAHARARPRLSQEEPRQLCPSAATVLANEQVVNGGYCWRHEDTLVESREIEQWFLKTTHYAEQLLDDLKELEGRLARARHHHAAN